MNATISRETPIGGCLKRLVGKPTATDKTVRDLPVKVKLKIGQIIVEQKLCGVVFSFPAAVWPDDPMRQRAWIMRLTPWWDMAAPDWTPQAQRLRDSCQRAINTLLHGAVCPGNREHPATDGLYVTRRPMLPNTLLSDRRGAGSLEQLVGASGPKNK